MTAQEMRLLPRLEEINGETTMSIELRLRASALLTLIFSLVLLGQATWPAPAYAATIEWTGARTGGDNISWEDARNWQSGSVPGRQDTAVVRRQPGGPANIQVPAEVVLDGLLLEDGGRLNNGRVLVNGSFTMTGGTIATSLELARR